MGSKRTEQIQWNDRLVLFPFSYGKYNSFHNFNHNQPFFLDRCLSLYPTVFVPKFISPLLLLSLLSFISLGGERYEKKEMQQQVRKRFSQLQQLDEKDGQIPWYVVNAAQTIEDVQKEINGIVEQTLEKIHGENLPVGLLWKKEGETKD